MVFMKEFFEKVDFLKKSADDEKPENFSVGKELNEWCYLRKFGILSWF